MIMTTLIADPPVAEITVHDNAEPLVDLATLGIACGRPRATAPHGRLVRLGLAERLIAADAELPPGVSLFVTEGFRTVESQQRIFTSYTDRLRTTSPGLSAAQIRRLASTYVAPLEVAPHVAGAAVDLSLIGGDGHKLLMGVDADAPLEERRSSRAFASITIGAAARANRTLLAEVLTAAGLVNYPTEWWHWSYGDRYWAFATGAPEAIYGPVCEARAA
jgi:D-alanyl-D-alanine dipeptidase